MDREKVIKGLHNARHYLEDKEWSDRGASPHIDAINDALSLLKELTADATCADCKWNRGNEANIVCERDMYRSQGNAWFCADGRRKDE